MPNDPPIQSRFGDSGGVDSGGSVGVLLERGEPRGLLASQCDGYDAAPDCGTHAGITFLPGQTDADRVLVFGSPIPPAGLGRRTLRERLDALRHGRARARLRRAWDALAVPRDRVDVLFYEPPGMVTDEAYEVARERARRVFGPDDRATDRVTLPVWWSLDETRDELAALEAPAKTVPLACVTSGKRMIPGHGARLDFIGALREAGVSLELHGRGLDPSLGGHGPIERKSDALLPARFALAIENDATCPGYVTEKLWDALLCWCVPIYHGSGAWRGTIPAEAVIELPTLDAAGVALVREVLADDGLYEHRLDAIAEARRRLLGPERAVAWYAREVWCADAERAGD